MYTWIIVFCLSPMTNKIAMREDLICRFKKKGFGDVWCMVLGLPYHHRNWGFINQSINDNDQHNMLCIQSPERIVYSRGWSSKYSLLHSIHSFGDDKIWFCAIFIQLNNILHHCPLPPKINTSTTQIEALTAWPTQALPSLSLLWRSSLSLLWTHCFRCCCWSSC